MGLRPATGTIQRNGATVRIRSPKDATGHGIGYLTEDRKGCGLLLGYGMRENLTLLGLDSFTGIFVDVTEQKRVATFIPTKDGTRLAATIFLPVTPPGVVVTTCWG